jgi:dynein heavy chain 1, cytosolic
MTERAEHFLQTFETWVDNLPEVNSPAWLGLPATAESRLQSLTGQRIISHIALMEDTFNDLEPESGEGDHKSQLLSMTETVSMWLSSLPENVDIPIQSQISTSLERCLGNEANKGIQVLKCVREDLISVMYVYSLPYHVVADVFTGTIAKEI